MRVLGDEEWVVLEAALDAARAREEGGRPLADERRTVEAVVWRLRNGAKRRAVPVELGPWWRAARLHIRWSRSGVWARAFARLRDAGRPELGEAFLDGTSVRAHQKAAGARGGRGPTPSAARAAATARRPAPRATPAAGRSPSP
jgi:transposase